MKAKDEIARLFSQLNSGELDPEEPLFCIRARDLDSSATVAIWAVLAASSGAPLTTVKVAQKVAATMAIWPIKQVPGKPDTRVRLDGKDL